ncbi:MAG TPA: DUF4267 domain-containing protein [Puia sp.]|nr:DUF4267 domain-containing protein [Puia sp.]
MKTQINGKAWGFRSLSWWLTLLPAAGIIFVGIRFMIAPTIGADGFGIPFSNADDTVFGKIKGIRDAFSGLVLLPLLWMGMRKATAWVFTAAIIVPFTDCMLVIATNGSGDWSHWLIHGGTALYMAFTSILLFKSPEVKVQGS